MGNITLWVGNFANPSEGEIYFEKIHHMHFEMTEEQYNRLHQNAKACGMSKRKYLIQLIGGNPPVARKREDSRWEGRYTAVHNPETGKPIA